MSPNRNDTPYGIEARSIKRRRLLTSAEEQHILSSDNWRKEVYRPLNSAHKEIRVLILQPSNVLKSDPEGRLETRTLPEAKFAGISYVWGNPVDHKWMILSGYRVQIGSNAHTALRYIRHPSKEKQIWLDAFCINQDDMEERGQQVRLMGEIFTRAKPVWLWTGRYTKHAKTFVEIVGNLQMMRDPDIHTISTLDMNSEDGQLLESMSAREWRSIEKFFRNPFWRRVWILQEIIMSAARGQGVLRFGHSGMNYNDFIKGAQALIIASQSFVWKYKKGTMARHCAVFQQQFCLKEDFEKRMLKITDAVELTDGLMATDPRDRIYGILGLFPDLEVRADYEKSIDKVREEATMAVLKYSGSLSFLLRCEIPEEAAPTRPSWVLNWGDNLSKPSCLSSVLDVDLYSACGGRRSSVFYREKRLEAQGCKLFRIDGLREFNFDGLSGIDSIRNLASIRQWMHDVYVTRNVQTEKSFEDAFKRAVMLDVYFSVDSQRTTRFGSGDVASHFDNLGKMKKFFRCIDDVGLNKALTEEEDEILKEHFTDIANQLVDTSFAVGPSGELCVLCGKAREGDWVALLAGLGVPAVLRPVDEIDGSSFQFVGPGYVHGAMDGEALFGSGKHMSASDPDTFDRVFDDIILV